ncbi:hypothetical protein QF037_009653 [Streptomyces canus]|jgi:hypothetical protein|nr:hypothetical protein [Streptomyces canus]
MLIFRSKSAPTYRPTEEESEMTEEFDLEIEEFEESELVPMGIPCSGCSGPCASNSCTPAGLCP